MVKILFLIHDFGNGGAEKVLVNLVNNMDQKKFDISVVSLFGGGVNEQFLAPHIHYRAVFSKSFPGNSKVMKFFTPSLLHKICVKGSYDIEVSYLEGPSARIISGCNNPNTKLVSWIHVETHTRKKLSAPFRGYKEAINCYKRFHQTICVSEYVCSDFKKLVPLNNPVGVLYNTVESQKILQMSFEDTDKIIDDGAVKMVAVGTLKESKGYARLLRIVERLKKNDKKVHLYILGAGPLEDDLKRYTKEHGLNSEVTFLGYDTNPYKYVAKCDLFVCASFAEGFSTAATEALIVGTPVCTVEVSGMKEMLGDLNEYGVVTLNDENALFEGILSLIDNPDKLAYYKKQAEMRGKDFSTETTVKAVEEMLLSL